MMIAAAAVNPTKTECDKKFTRNPSRPAPITMCTTPTISASSAAAPRYPAVPSSTRGARDDAVSSETIATGPTASWREVANKA